ncbi:hypothetical protein AB0M43_37195 [Longispora sp. NPDC051575]|uniref:hypothetical protein n=1 Tax=Longispora sp. NPDC051575 TaxID=3154943 RepID=UPI003417B617
MAGSAVTSSNATALVDPDLARAADHLAARHTPSAADPARCSALGCAEAFPCLVARFAARAAVAARASRREAWTARLDAVTAGIQLTLPARV